MQYIITFIKGIVIGIADAVPGVSGGTMAVVLKIYDQLLDVITLNLKKLKANWKFILPLGIGVVLGILVAAKALAFLFDQYSVPTNLFFMGVVLGSVPMIFREATAGTRFTTKNLLPVLVGIAVLVGVFLLNRTDDSASYYTTINPSLFGYLILVLAISTIAMIIPGISGSFMMMVFGVFQTIMHAINSMNFAILLPCVIGGLIGLFGGAKIISYLLKRYHNLVYLVILGMVLGSLYAIFPRGFSFNAQGIVGIGMFIVGVALPIVTDKKEVKA